MKNKLSLALSILFIMFVTAKNSAQTFPVKIAMNGYEGNLAVDTLTFFYVAAPDTTLQLEAKEHYIKTGAGIGGKTGERTSYIYFNVDTTGNVSLYQNISATASANTITLKTFLVTINVGNYTEGYMPSFLKNSIQTKTAVFSLIAGQVYYLDTRSITTAGNYSSCFYFLLSPNGDVYSEKQNTATTAGSVIQLNTCLVKIDPQIISGGAVIKLPNGKNISQPKEVYLLTELIYQLSWMEGSNQKKFNVIPCNQNSGELPVGTIISSMLTYDQLCKQSGNEPAWHRLNFWAPADGRNVQHSTYTAVTGNNFVPDLRGVFLRGKNQIDATETTPVSADRADPAGNRIAGSLQQDTLQKHSHDLMDQPIVNRPGNFSFNNGTSYRGGIAATKESGDDETRPKNVAVYSYIKIN